MTTLRRLLAPLATFLALVAIAPRIHAQAIVVDGVAGDWFGAPAGVDNVGIVRRSATAPGEYVWRDNVGDARTDLVAPETQADITRVMYTSSAAGLYVFVELAANPALGDGVQVQVAIDTDRVSGSGQNFLTGLADTSVSNAARWEFLVQTQFSAGGTARVLNTAFMPVGTVTAAHGADGVELLVPWLTLGMAAPPTTPLRFTVATFREQLTGDTVDIGGTTVSNALDVVTDYGDPRASAYPNTFAEVSDAVIDYFADVHFAPIVGGVYAPLVVQRFVADPSSTTSGGAWIEIRNVSPNLVTLTGFKLGDEETPDGPEGMDTFPATMTLATGATYVVADRATSFFARYGTQPDAEFNATDVTVPDMTAFAPWATGPVALDAAGDEIVVLDPSNTILDLVNYGTSSYPGVTPREPAPGSDEVLSRSVVSLDTDNNNVDFGSEGTLCSLDGGVACLDAGVDAAVDVALDVGVDVAVDVPVDAARDVVGASDVVVATDVVVASDVLDAGVDVAVDAGVDAGTDVADASAGDTGATDSGGGTDVAIADTGVGTDASTPTDAQVGRDASAGSDGGATADGGVFLTGAGACACRAAGGARGGDGALAMLGLSALGLALSRRRRARNAR